MVKWHCYLNEGFYRVFYTFKTKGVIIAIVGATLLSLANAQAADLFAGITEVSAQPLERDRQVIKMTADLPFEYQRRVIDQDHVALKLINAKLSSQLIQGPNQLQLRGANRSGVRQATLQKANVSANEIEIVLTGPGLAQKQLVVEGATEVPLQQTSFATASSSNPPEVTPDLRASSTQRRTTLVEQTPLASSIKSTLRPALTRTDELNLAHLQEPILQEAAKAYQAGHYEDAKKSLDKAISEDPKNAKLYAALGELQIAEHRYASAQAAYAKAYMISPVDMAFRYAEMLVLTRQRPLATIVLKKLITQTYAQDTAAEIPWGKVYYTLGTLYEETGDHVMALPYLKRAAEYLPDDASVHYNLGLAYELNSQTDMARMHYGEAQKLDPGAPDIQKAVVRMSSEALRTEALPSSSLSDSGDSGN